MQPLTGVDEMDWPFISYDPTTEPPLPQATPPRPTMMRRVAAFGAQWFCRTTAYLYAALAIYVLATGRI